MRLPDRLPTKLGTLTNDLTHAASETSWRARVWTEQLGTRITRSSLFTRHTQWMHEMPVERVEEDVWRTETGLNAPHVLQTSAPIDFTAGVMARIAAQQAPRSAPRLAPAVSFSGIAIEPVRMLAGTVCISAMVALISSCVLAILAPTQALALLGWLVSAGTFALLVLRGFLGVVTSLLASSGALIILSSLGALTMVTLLHYRQSGDQIVHEA